MTGRLGQSHVKISPYGAARGRHNAAATRTRLPPSRSLASKWVPKRSLGTSHSCSKGTPKTMNVLVAQAFQPVRAELSEQFLWGGPWPP